MSFPPSVVDQAAPAEPTPDQWFATEVQPHESKLRAWLRARFPSLTDIDDVVQEAYLRLVRARSSGQVRQAKPYLYATARNAVLDHFRHEQVIPMDRLAEITELPVLVDNKANAVEAVSQDEELALLSAAIRDLPERCREILVLRKLHGLSQKEIARRLGISENTVAAQASMGVRRCIAYFRERSPRG
ncbi:MAG: sigma-70 family RNA polymerase sigma factor [Opitutae bacterium]|nr:sigma-70 family RNA polymerase sigma factor [Opitutae bacterium]